MPQTFIVQQVGSSYNSLLIQARELKRLDSILRSQVYAHVGETLAGLTTIRAYHKQIDFSKAMETALDVMNRANFIAIINQCWVGLRLDLIGDLLIFVLASLVVSSRFYVSASISGLVLSYCIQALAEIGQLPRLSADVENSMNATERIHHYATFIENEPAWHISQTKPRPSWPENGELIIKDVVLRYRDGLPTALNGLSLHIRGGERVAIGTILLNLD